MSKNILNLFILAVVLIIVIGPATTFAQGGGNPAGGGGNPPSGTIKIENPFKTNTIQGFIRAVVNDILIPIGAVVAVLMVIYAGFKYVTAGGDSKKIGEAHDALLWAVIGAAILLGAWVISEAIQGTINALKR